MRHIAPNTIRARLSPARLSAARVSRRGWQIGPRIRVGGTLGAIGEGVKQNLGQVAKIAAVPVSFVNPALGAALAVGGRALHTNEGAAGVGDLVGAGVKNYATGKIGSAVLGGVRRALPAIGGAIAGRAVGGGAPATDVNGGSMIPGGPDFDPSSGGAGGGGGMPWEQILAAVTGGGTQGGGGIDWGSLLGKVGGFVKDNGLDLAMAGLATAQGVNAAKASSRAGGFQDKAINLAEQNWAAGAPLRAAGTTRLLTPKAANLSSVYTDPSNPFARVRRIA
jgi:hypothetical protein